MLKYLYQFNQLKRLALLFVGPSHDSYLLCRAHNHHSIFNPLISMIIFGVLGNLVMNVLLPTCYIVGVKKSTLSDLGIQRAHLTSLAISILLAAISILLYWNYTYYPPTSDSPYF